jgi:hypothetical protein
MLRILIPFYGINKISFETESGRSPCTIRDGVGPHENATRGRCDGLISTEAYRIHNQFTIPPRQ